MLIVLHLLLLALLFLLSMTRHLSVEFPAHLSEGLLLSQFSALLVEIVKLNSVIVLVTVISESFHDVFPTLVLVSPNVLVLPKHTSLSKDLQSKGYAFANKFLFQLVHNLSLCLLRFIFFYFLRVFCFIRLRVKVWDLGQDRLEGVLSSFSDSLRWKGDINYTSKSILGLRE